MNMNESRTKESPWVTTWRVAVATLAVAGTAIGSYATLWVKANAPTRSEFIELARMVQNLREDLLIRSGQEQRIGDHESRIRKLEEDSHRRFPPPRNP